MRIKSRITALLTVILMLLMQVPLSSFAAVSMTGMLTPGTLKNGKVGESYGVNFEYSNGTYMSNSWYIEGELPQGLTLSQNTTSDHPVISGIPTQAGSYTFKMQAITRIGTSSDVTVVFEKNYTLIIEPADPLEITGDTKWYGYELSSGSYAFEHTCEVNSEFAAAWSMEAADGETLPEGLTIESATGKITWAEPKVGKYQMKITATCNGETVSKTLKLIVIPFEGCKHQSPSKTVGTEATCKQNGTADYWYCDDCESYFYDANCKKSFYRDLDKLYTTAFHSDKNNDGICDTEGCGKTMPIFKKVTNNEEITNCGMYLVVSKIGDKYYTLKIPEEETVLNFETVEITPNADGSFDYLEADTGVMILKTAFAAMSTELDAGQPRYSFGTNINGVPYCLTGNDYSNKMRMEAYESSDKYGYRINLTADENAEIASVYSAYWGNGESGKGKGGSSESNSGIFSAYEETADEGTKIYFSFATSDTSAANPVELYKLTYVGETSGGQNYTLSDAQSTVTINNEFTVLNDFGSKTLSTTGGISDALKTSYVESVISSQTGITGTVSVRTYADINLMSGESTVDSWSNTNISSLLYEVTPKIELKGESSGTTYTQQIDDENFDGSEITVTLCVGNMNPAKIIHYKTDGTKEYFYNKNFENLGAEQKTFSVDQGDMTGNFVTFTVDSFSNIEILSNAINYGEEKLEVQVNKTGTYTLLLANYSENRMSDVKLMTKSLQMGQNSITNLGGFTPTNGGKIFLFENLATLKPLCQAFDVISE